MAKRCRQLTSVQIAREMAAATRTPLSILTLRHELYKRGLHAKRPIICIPLTLAVNVLGYSGAKIIVIEILRTVAEFSLPTNLSPYCFGECFAPCSALESNSRRVTI
ncbi:hypothetical protein NPIL_448681 [Nephila pilipes]|uniref:Uncharacterized protein n=1 Tax=Nephila pilipes TaxID=299642 RepID=A0A8X6JQ13_NEPPI|nr:hypothetical protein NPIL_448681 [Nephila pilipes]